MKLLKTEKLQEYSDQPVKDWEAKCRQLKLAQVASTKTVSEIKKGAQIRYPVGSVEDVEPRFYPSWLKGVKIGDEEIEVESCWGKCLVKAHSWEEKRKVEPYVEYPEKPDSIQGFDWSSPSQVCELINEILVLHFHVTHFDVAAPRNGYYTFEKLYASTKVGDIYWMGDHEDGCSEYQDVRRTYHEMRIFPSYWEIWEYDETFPELVGGDHSSDIAYDHIKASSDDGMWRK